MAKKIEMVRIEVELEDGSKFPMELTGALVEDDEVDVGKLIRDAVVVATEGDPDA